MMLVVFNGKSHGKRPEKISIATGGGVNVK